MDHLAVIIVVVIINNWHIFQEWPTLCLILQYSCLFFYHIKCFKWVYTMSCTASLYIYQNACGVNNFYSFWQLVCLINTVLSYWILVKWVLQGGLLCVSGSSSLCLKECQASLKSRLTCSGSVFLLMQLLYPSMWVSNRQQPVYNVECLLLQWCDN